MTVLGGAPILAADINEALNREIDADIQVSNGTATNAGTGAELLDRSLTVALKSGRTYRVSSVFPYNGSVTGDDFFFLIRQGTLTSDTQLGFVTGRVHNSARAWYVSWWIDFVCPADGNYTFGTFYRRAAGTGTCTPVGATSSPRILSVDLKTTA